MNVKELIRRLEGCPPDAEVKYFVGWDDQRDLHEISPEDSDGNVVMGDDLPPELYARDYRHER